LSLILTLQLDTASQLHFNRLRERYFPPALNYIDAHVTLFHTLPKYETIIDTISSVAGIQASFDITVTGIRSLGKGVAYTLESPALQSLHCRLTEAFTAYLTPQDHQKFQPHIVVQNKVTPAAARVLLQQLQTTFVRTHAEATGLHLWHYRGGPWDLAQTFPFALKLRQTKIAT